MARRAAFRTEDIGLLRCGCRRPIAKVFPCKKGKEDQDRMKAQCRKMNDIGMYS